MSRHVAGNPLDILLHAWPVSFSRFLLRDIVVNIALYVPLGFAAHMVLRRTRLPLLGFYGPVLLGFCLSAAMETAQLYTPTRDTSLLDLSTNTIGSAIGVAVAVWFERIADPWRLRLREAGADRGALMLVFCWAAWQFFPFFPVIGTYAPMRKVVGLAAGPLFAPMQFVSAAAVWFALGLLLSRSGVPHSRKWLAYSVLAVPTQLFIAGRRPTLSDFLGAIAGCLLFAARPRAKGVSEPEAWAFLAVVILRGLSPFRFVAAASAFNWIPFAALLQTEWQYAVEVLLGKIFFYTAAIWLLRRAGMKLRLATAIPSLWLASIEVVQTHLPGRTPEITDPILATLMGFVLFILSREKGRRFRSAE